MLSLVSEGQEVQMGQEARDQVRAQMGLYEDEALQAYVDSVGQALAAVSERPDLPWSFAIVDDPVINAFALPGGPVYLARGIMAYFSSEAEMASVLGHEIGHITARHAVEAISRQQLAQLGFVAGMVAVPELRPFGDVLSGGLGLLFLKYGRDDESQSDLLGHRYMTRLDYDPQAAVEMFQILDRQREASGSAIPEWQSSHPDPGNRRRGGAAARRRRTATRAAPCGARSTCGGSTASCTARIRARDISATTGSSIRACASICDFPADWPRQNTPMVVQAISPDQDAMIELTIEPDKTPAQAAGEFWNIQGMQRLGSSNQTVNGLPAVLGRFRVVNQQGAALEGLVMFVEHREPTFRVLGYTSAAAGRAVLAGVRADARQLRAGDRFLAAERRAEARRHRRDPIVDDRGDLQSAVPVDRRSRRRADAQRMVGRPAAAGRAAGQAGRRIRRAALERRPPRARFEGGPRRGVCDIRYGANLHISCTDAPNDCAPDSAPADGDGGFGAYIRPCARGTGTGTVSAQPRRNRCITRGRPEYFSPHCWSLGLPAGASAQVSGTFSVDGNAGVSIPLGTLGDLTSTGGAYGGGLSIHFTPNWALRGDLLLIKLDNGRSESGTLLSPPVDMLYYGGGIEVNFNAPLYQDLPLTFAANLEGGWTNVDVDETYSASNSANGLDQGYFTISFGGQVGYTVYRGSAFDLNLFAKGQAYLILTDSNDMFQYYGPALTALQADAPDHVWVLPITAGARFTF